MKEELLNRIKEQKELENLYYKCLGVIHGVTHGTKVIK
jgi:hypothetical protein|tara:strand:+ start:67 stop:180 length:114 start_codon:yes stop_codon:yes gene_type:complete